MKCLQAFGLVCPVTLLAGSRVAPDSRAEGDCICVGKLPAGQKWESRALVAAKWVVVM